VTYLSSWYSAQHSYRSRNSLTCKWLVATARAHGICHLAMFLPSWIQEWPFENSNSWAPILTPVILAPQQAELRKTEVQRIARPILC
jgi:hypothetical protein